MTDQNALANHFHKYPEHLIPNQYINTAGITSSYLDTLPIGSVIYWPEMIRLKFIDGDTETDIIKRNNGIAYETDNFVCYTPILSGSYQRCNGDPIKSTDKQIIYSLISSGFGKDTTHNIKTPDLRVSTLSENISNDFLNEKYKTGYFLLGDNINDTIDFSYMMCWSSGIGQEHNGKVERTQRINIINNNIKLEAGYNSDKNAKDRQGGQCIIFALDLPSSNYEHFFDDKKIVFYGFGSSNKYIITEEPSEPTDTELNDLRINWN